MTGEKFKDILLGIVLIDITLSLVDLKFDTCAEYFFKSKYIKYETQVMCEKDFFVIKIIRRSSINFESERTFYGNENFG